MSRGKLQSDAYEKKEKKDREAGKPINWISVLPRKVQLNLGEGPIGIVGPMSQTRGIIDVASLTLYRTNALMMRVLIQLYSGQLRETCTLMYRGTELHWARILKWCFINKYPNIMLSLFQSGSLPKIPADISRCI